MNQLLAVGPTDVAWDWWRQQHSLPQELFTKWTMPREHSVNLLGTSA